MLKQIQAIIAKLEVMQSRAEELADSENETTADRYADVPGEIGAAIDALNNAVEALQ